MNRSPKHLRHRGSVVIIVLWAIAVAALITSSVQLFGHRQAMIARETLERVQARWAARAGIEDTLAVMTEHTENPVLDDALALFREMHFIRNGDMLNASYDIYHYVEGQARPYGGPMDEHSKMNINRESDRSLLLVLEDMTLDVQDAVGDWIDEDDDANTLGVERDYYQSLEGPYLPRNGPVRSLGELELIAGIWPKYFRGDDWNLNNRLDANENDSGRSTPPDESDNLLHGQWSSRLTTYTVAGGATDSGEPRIHLEDATTEELIERLGISEAQATSLIAYGKEESNMLSDLILSSPTAGDNEGNPSPNAQGGNNAGANSAPGSANAANGVAGLNDDQLRAVLAETCIEDPLERLPGKMNLNTIAPDFLRDIVTFIGLDEAIADEIIFMRDAEARGIISLVDLRTIPNITDDDLRAITRLFDTRSSVFTITSRGRSWSSGLEVEIIAVVDRSTVPIRIIEYREQ